MVKKRVSKKAISRSKAKKRVDRKTRSKPKNMPRQVKKSIPKKNIAKTSNKVAKSKKSSSGGKVLKKITSTKLSGAYVTDFDRFYDFIIKNENIRIPKLCARFKITKKQVEEWARILEDRGLIEVHYPLFGSPRLKCVN
jgi:hypothetical protein